MNKTRSFMAKHEGTQVKEEQDNKNDVIITKFKLSKQVAFLQVPNVHEV